MSLCLTPPTFAQRGPVGPVRDAYRALRERAVEQVVASSRSADPFVRANAIEAAGSLDGPRLVPIVQLGMRDAEPVVRFSALATIGKLELKDLAAAVREQVGAERRNVAQIERQILEQGQRMTDEERLRFRERLADAQSVYAAAVFAGNRTGAVGDPTPLGSLLMRKDATVRGNVALLLGHSDDRTAVPMLRDAARVPMPTANPVRATLARLQIAEAMVRLGDDAALEPIRAAAYSHFDEVRVLAVIMLGRLGDQRMAPALAAMLKDPPIELQLAAASSLARMGNYEGLPAALQGVGWELQAVRVQAASTLSLFDDQRAVDALARLLNDPDEPVRLAAAAAILQANRR